MTPPLSRCVAVPIRLGSRIRTSPDVPHWNVKLRIPELADGRRRVEFALPAARLNERLETHPGWSEERLASDLELRGEVYRTRDDVHIEATVTGTLEATCPRCLEEFRAALERRFVFVWRKGEPESEDDDDAGVGHYAGDEIDLAPLAVEQALLEIGGTMPCREDCKGLCPGCGVNRNQEVCRCSTE